MRKRDSRGVILMIVEGGRIRRRQFCADEGEAADLAAIWMREDERCQHPAGLACCCQLSGLPDRVGNDELLLMLRTVPGAVTRAAAARPQKRRGHRE